MRLAQIIGTAIFLECCLELTICLHLIQNGIQLCGQSDTRQWWLHNGIIQAELEIEKEEKQKLSKCVLVERCLVASKDFAYVYRTLNITRILFDVNRFPLAIHLIISLHLQMSFHNVTASIEIRSEENT